MAGQSFVLRGTALDGKIRVFAMDSRQLVDELRKRHGLSPLATAALGRTATAAAMMGMMLKDKQKVTVRVRGDGPLGQIVVDADAEGNVRGYVGNPLVHLPLTSKGKLDVRGAVGEGTLYVIKDLGLKEPYHGSVPIVSGELAEDFTYYFAKSEQIPSAVALGVLVDRDYTVRAAGGFIIQLLPEIREEEISEVEASLADLPPVTRLLDEGWSVERIMEHILPTFVPLDKREARFQCQCSRERVKKMLVSLGRDELDAMIRDREPAEVVCHFCNEKHLFTVEQLEELMH